MIDYHWDELWRAIVAVLVFVLAKQDTLAHGATAIEAVIAEAIVVLDLALARADGFLPTPESVHQLVVSQMESCLNDKAADPYLVRSRSSIFYAAGSQPAKAKGKVYPRSSRPPYDNRIL